MLELYHLEYAYYCLYFLILDALCCYSFVVGSMSLRRMIVVAHDIFIHVADMFLDG